MGIQDAIGDVFGGQNNVQGQTPQPWEAQLIDMMKRQNETQTGLQNMLLPFQLKQMGLEGTFDANGKLSGVREAGTPEEIAQRKTLADKNLQIQGAAQDRQLAAMSGTLPVDPALERNISEGTDTLRETLRKQLGTGYETSDPGIRSLATNNQRAEELRYMARTGQMTQASQLGSTAFGQSMTSAQLNEALRSANLSELAGIGNVYNSSIGNLLGGMNYGQSGRVAYSGLQLNADTGNANRNSATMENQANRFNSQATAPFSGGGGGGIAALFA